MVSGLILKSLIHLESIFVCGVRQWSSFILLHIPVHFSISLIDHTVLSLLYTLSCLTVNSLTVCVSSVQLFGRVRLFVTPWTAAHQASLSITNSPSLLKLMSTESLMPSNHLILCRPHLLLPSIFPSIRVFPMSRFFASSGQSIGASA